MTTNSVKQAILSLHPSDLERVFTPQIITEREEVLEKLSKLYDQNYIQIDQIEVKITQNTHLGDHTYSCKVVINSPTKGADFVHEEEGRDYLEVVHAATNATIKFVQNLKDKLANH